MNNIDRTKLTIQLMSATHVRQALDLCRESGWNQLPEDWRRLLDYEPDGCFVAMVDEQLVGTVTTTRYGRELSWIGMMLVRPDFRRRGTALALMRRSIDFLTNENVQCIKLDATPVGQHVYERLGFQVEWPFQRWSRAGSSTSIPIDCAKTASSQDSNSALTPSLLELDRIGFGADRGILLQRLASDSFVHVIRGGYGMLRSGFLASYLGPVIASTPIAAQAIISELLKQTDRDIFWDIPGPNAHAIQIARTLGFTPIRDLTRMRLGNELSSPDLQKQFALADPGTG